MEQESDKPVSQSTTVTYNGGTSWYMDGKLHREYEPVIYPDTTIWRVNCTKSARNRVITTQ